MWDIEIHIRVSKDMVEQLDHIANEYGLNRSQIIRLALKSFIKNHRELLDDVMRGFIHEINR